MGVTYPKCSAGSPEIALHEINPRELLNGPEPWNTAERSSWVRDWILEHPKIKLVQAFRKIRTVTDDIAPDVDESFRPITKYNYVIPEPEDGNIPGDVAWELAKAYPGLELKTGVKQLAQDWILILGPADLEVPWVSSKAGGVSHQPGAKAKAEDVEFQIQITDEHEPYTNGAMRVSQEILDKVAKAYGIREPVTAVKLSGKWPHASKIVLFVDPNMRDPKEFIYSTENDKGIPRKAGPGTFRVSEYRLVADSRSYFRMGTQLAYQAIALAQNWREIAETHIKPQLELLKGVVEESLPAIQEAMRLEALFDLPTPGSVPANADGAKRDFFAVAEGLIASGVSPSVHPMVQKAGWQIAHYLGEDLSRGIWVKEGHMAYALPTRQANRGEIILSKEAWLYLGRPTIVTAIRYPVNKPSELRRYQVKWTKRLSDGEGKAIYMNPKDWNEYHNGDFDGDLCFVTTLNIEAKQEKHEPMEKGSGRASKSIYEETYKTCTASNGVGGICNRLTLVRAVEECFEIDTSGWQTSLATAYHLAIQAVKNCDFDARPLMQACANFLERHNLPTLLPWSIRQPSDESGLRIRNAASWNDIIDQYLEIDEKWESCLHGWVARHIGKIVGKYSRTEPVVLDRLQFSSRMTAEPLFEHSVELDEKAKQYIRAYFRALDVTAVRKASGCSKEDAEMMLNSLAESGKLGRRPLADEAARRLIEVGIGRGSDPTVRPDFSEVRRLAKEINELDGWSREIIALIVGKYIASKPKMSPFLFDLIAPKGEGMLAHKIYGWSEDSKAIRTIDAVVRYTAAKSLEG